MNIMKNMEEDKDRWYPLDLGIFILCNKHALKKEVLFHWLDNTGFFSF